MLWQVKARAGRLKGLTTCIPFMLFGEAWKHACLVPGASVYVEKEQRLKEIAQVATIRGLCNR
jgi:hypothetical protein